MGCCHGEDAHFLERHHVGPRADRPTLIHNTLAFETLPGDNQCAYSVRSPPMPPDRCTRARREEAAIVTDGNGA